MNDQYHHLQQRQLLGKGSIEDNGKAYNGDNEERSMPRLRHIATVVEGN